jgi:hypothetical protein
MPLTAMVMVPAVAPSPARVRTTGEEAVERRRRRSDDDVATAPAALAIGARAATAKVLVVLRRWRLRSDAGNARRRIIEAPVAEVARAAIDDIAQVTAGFLGLGWLRARRGLGDKGQRHYPKMCVCVQRIELRGD